METDPAIPRKAERAFYFAAIALLLVAIAATLVQKRCESAAAIAGAKRVAVGAEATDDYKSNVQHTIEDGANWGILSFSAVLLGIVSLGIGVWRREKHRLAWVCIVVLLSVYGMLKLMMV